MEDIKLIKSLPVITMNFIEVKASLIANAEKYKNILVTEDGLKDCKAMQGELSSTRIKLDNYRKDVKKELTKPITIFEDQCKELIALVVEVETPLKAGIEVFNQKVREANRQIAEDIIKTAIAEHGLNEKYSLELVVLDKYMNLTSKPTDVKNDVEQRLFLLLQKQDEEIQTLQIMKDTIENINKNIDAKLSLEDFQSLIDMNYSPVKIMAEINSRGERIKAQELKAIADNKAKAEKEVLERIAKAEREQAEKTRIEERNIRIAKEAAEDTIRIENAKEAERLKNASLPKEEPKETIIHNVFSKNPITLSIEKEEMYFIDMHVEGNLNEIKALSKFLKDNQYNYKATNKGSLN